MKNESLQGMGLAAVAGLLCALTLAASALIPRDVPMAETVWGRYGMQLLILAIAVLPLRGRAVLRSHHPRLQLLRASMMVVMPVAFAVATPRIGAADAWAAVWIAPLAGLAVSQWVFGESISRSTWLLVSIATAGALAAHEPRPAFSLTGLAAAAVAGISFGAFLTLTPLLRSDRPSTGLFWTAACVFVCASLFVGRNWQPLTPRAIAGLAAMGGLWLFVLLAVDEALRRAPLSVVAPFLLTEIIWTRLLFHLPWSGRALLGSAAVLTVMAVCVLTRGRARTVRLTMPDLVDA